MILADTWYCFKEDGDACDQTTTTVAGRCLHCLTKLRKLVEGLPQFNGELGTDIEQVSPERLLEHHRTTPPARTNANASAVEAVDGDRLPRGERELRKLARIGQGGGDAH